MESESSNELQPQQSYPTIKSIHKYTINYVIKRGFFNLVRYMLNLGVDPNYVNEKDEHRQTALILCTFIKDENWSLNVAHNLLEHGALLNITDSRYLNAIHYCCAFGREKLLQVYLNGLDFDLSKALDINGNSCLHYAIYSHNLNCVNMLLRKYRHFNMRKVDLRNIYGLRPSDIQLNNDLLIKIPGRNSLLECKRTLNHLVKYFNDLRELELARKRAQEELERKLAADAAAAAAAQSKSKWKKKAKSKKSSISSSNAATTSLTKKKNPPSKSDIETIHEVKEIDDISFILSDKSKSPNSNRRVKKSSNYNNSRFFATELDEISTTDSQLIFRNISPIRATTANSTKKSKKANKSKSPPSQNSRSMTNIKEVIKEETISTIFSRESLGSINNQPILISEEQAKNLTNKSLIITYKDFLNSLIEYNDLFYAKEHMLESAFESNYGRKVNQTKEKKKDDKIRITRSHSSFTKRDEIYTKKIENKTAKPPPPPPPPDWKRELPTMFKKLELFITPSYRETVYPPLNKKVSKNPKRELHEQKQELKRALVRLKRFEKSKEKNNNSLRKFSTSSISQTNLRSSSVLSYVNSVVSFDGSQIGDDELLDSSLSINNHASFLDTITNKNNKNKILD